MSSPLHVDPSLEVSVVVATHRLENLQALLGTIRSVSEQTLAPARVVVAVDHAPELARRVAEELPHVVVAANDGEHRGASATRNAGAAACSTPLIAFLDDDETAEPDWLATLVPPLAEDHVVGTGGRYVPAWEGTRPGWFPDELAWTVGGHHSGMPEVAAPVRNVWSGNMAVKAEVFHGVGGFRAGFGKTGDRSRPEDTDLCIRMANSRPGGVWIYVPEARIEHHVPHDRSGFGFYVKRCYAEGRGKIDLRDANPEVDALSTERDYLRRTIPRGVGENLRDAGRALARAGAIVVGVGAAGVGAVASTAAGRRARS